MPKPMPSEVDTAREKPPAAKKGTAYGSGITEEQLERIISDFEKR